MTAITLSSIRRQAAGTLILDDVSLQIESGELMAIVGPSGSGKTSIVRAIAGLDKVASGSLLFDDEVVTHMAVAERDVGLVTAENTLFPTHSGRNNIGMALLARSVGRTQIDKRVEAEARALHISDIIDRWPNELSAGHQQLVQIARAMVRVPKVLLLDEPMANLDVPTRRRLRAELRQLQKGYGVTTILATNDPADAMFMADRLAAVESGRIRQVGTPTELYDAPASTHIAWLTGTIGLLDATVHSETGGFWLVGDGFRLRAWAPSLTRFVGARVRVAVRPEHLVPTADSDTEVTVVSHSFDAGRPITKVRLGDHELAMLASDSIQGETISVRFDEYLVFDETNTLVHST